MVDKKHIELYTFGLITLFLWVFIWLKAYNVPPTQDEANSFFEYIVGDWSRVFKASSPNNHFLNSALGKLTTSLFGDSMFVFRLPNVLAFPVFGFYLWQIANRLNAISRWGLIIGLFGCYPLIEYFGLARGYALSNTLILASTHYIILYAKSTTNRFLLCALLSTVLAVSANLALLPFSLAVLAILMYLSYSNSKRIRFIHFAPMLILPVLLGFASIGLKHKVFIQAHFQDDSGFVGATVNTLVNMMTYSIENPVTLFVIFTPLVLGLVFNLSTMWTKKTAFNRPYWIVFFMVLACVTAAYLLSWLFDVHFPTNRVALYFVPLYFLLIFLAGHEQNPSWKSKVIPFISALPSLALVVAFILSFNTSRSHVEPFAHLPESEYLNILSTHNDSVFTGVPVVAADERLSHAWRYYNFKHGSMLSNLISSPYDPSDIIMPNARIRPLTICNSFKSKAHNSRNHELIGLYKDTLASTGADKIYTKFKLTSQNSSPTIHAYCQIKALDGQSQYDYSCPVDNILVEDSVTVFLSWPFPECDSCEVNIFLHNVDRATLSIH